MTFVGYTNSTIKTVNTFTDNGSTFSEGYSTLGGAIVFYHI
jgi:hypothetical protein